jgi:hypothetical protein
MPDMLLLRTLFRGLSMQSNTWFSTPARRIAGALGSLIALTVLLRFTAGTRLRIARLIP